MDWSKAKNILLFLFLILNICLAVYIIKFKDWDSTGNNIINTQKILETRGYQLKTAVPAQTKAFKLNYTNVEYDRMLIAQQLLQGSQLSPHVIHDNQPLIVGSKNLVFESKNTFVFNDPSPNSGIKLSGRDKAEQYARKVLADLKFPVSKLQLDTYHKNKDNSMSLIFIEKYKNYYIFDNTAEFKLTEKGIKYLKCKFVQVKGFSSSKVEIVPAYQILLKEFVDGKNSIITDIDLGYESFIENGTMESSNNPVWRVRLSDGISKYFTIMGERKQ